MSIPADLKYTADHEWIRFDGDIATTGITAHAANELGDVVFIELPSPGDSIAAGSTCGEIESTKSVSDFIAPATGEVLTVNALIVDNPGLVNTDPYGDGWLIMVTITSEPDLLDASQYESLVAGGVA